MTNRLFLRGYGFFSLRVRDDCCAYGDGVGRESDPAMAPPD